MKKSNKTEIAREYNKKTYDRICLTVKKGQRDKIKKFAKEKRNKSLNGYFVDLVEEDMKKVWENVDNQFGSKNQVS